MKKNLLLTIILFSMIMLLSCKKNDLISRDYIREFKIDTLFYKSLDLNEFFVGDGSFQPRPVMQDNHIYFLANRPHTDSNSYYSPLYKIDAGTGETLWKWLDYGPGIEGIDRSVRELVCNEEYCILITYQSIYVVDAVSGSTIYRYVPPPDTYLKGAGIYQDRLFAALQDSSCYVVEMNPDGSGLEVAISNNDLGIKGFSDMKVLHKGDFACIVIQGDGSYSRNSTIKELIIAEISGPFFLMKFDIGGDVLDVSRKYPVILMEDGSIVACGDHGFRSFFMRLENPVIWQSERAVGLEILYNDRNIYNTVGGLMILDRKNGKVKYRNYLFSRDIQAVTNSLLLSPAYPDLLEDPSYPGIDIYDAETGDFLMKFNGKNVSVISKINENEFFIADRYKGGRIGKLRITPLKKAGK